MCSKFSLPIVVNTCTNVHITAGDYIIDENMAKKKRKIVGWFRN